ncbi:MAG: biopolymer transporter ExbD [Polyangiales bacterium]
MTIDELRRLKRRDTAHAPVRPRPVMNVTPLVDVVLVLLIIFMVVIPALQQGMNIEVSGILNVDPQSESKSQPFVLSVASDHRMFFEEEQVTQGTLESKLRAASRSQPGRRVVVRADKAADYAQVRDIYRIAQQSGFPGVSLRVNRVQDDAR